MEDIAAWAILLSLLVFGFPLIACSDEAPYKHVLTGWVIIISFVIGVVVAFRVSFWALSTVLT